MQFNCEQRIFINFRQYITRHASRAKIRADSSIDSSQAELSRVRLLSLTRRARAKSSFVFAVSQRQEILIVSRRIVLTSLFADDESETFSTGDEFRYLWLLPRRGDARSIFDRRISAHARRSSSKCRCQVQTDRDTYYVVYLCPSKFFLLFALA